MRADFFDIHGIKVWVKALIKLVKKVSAVAVRYRGARDEHWTTFDKHRVEDNVCALHVGSLYLNEIK
jgi:hypothetical protein